LPQLKEKKLRRSKKKKEEGEGEEEERKQLYPDVLPHSFPHTLQ
jgi:hypothetical protein